VFDLRLIQFWSMGIPWERLFLREELVREILSLPIYSSFVWRPSVPFFIMLNKMGLLRGFLLPSGVLDLAIYFFADDSLIFCKVNQVEW
jgi:hypothetical protein